jgi:hypothetical protein
MKAFKKQLLAAALLVTSGFGLTLLNGLRPDSRQQQPAVINETERVETSTEDTAIQSEDKSRLANVESKKNFAQEKSISVNIKRWGLNSWSRLRRGIRRLV